MKYKLLVFDWDGTLYDSAAFIVDCVQASAKEAGYPVPEAKVVRQMIGLSSHEAFKQTMPDLSPMQVANLIQVFRARMASTGTGKPVLFDGAKAVLQQLKAAGFCLAIATGKSRAGLDRDLDELGIADLFMATRCSDETQSKPHPQMLNELLEELDMRPEDTLVIGDTEYDLLMAEKAHVDALAAAYGVHDRERLQFDNVKGFLEDIRDLPKWLQTSRK